jgi:type IV pilus assembly protein PilA
MIMKRALAKKNGKKGFTLVEVIVVLVILAILAAIAIPALTGYIDKANKRAIITEARSIAVALQATASDYYGTESKGVVTAATTPAANTLTASNASSYTGGTAGTLHVNSADGTATGTGDTWNKAVADLTSDTYYTTNTGAITKIAFNGNKLAAFTFTKTGGKSVAYINGTYTVL